MNILKPLPLTADPALEEIARQQLHDAAMQFLTEAFAEALVSGIDADFFAQAALRAAMVHLSHEIGVENTARMAEGLPQRIRNGEFSLVPRH